MREKTKRDRKLSYQWYPDNSVEIIKFIKKYIKNKPIIENNVAAIIPHAGWSFSGSLAVEVISSLHSKADTIVVIGGHLPSGSPLLYSPEDIYETPLGYLNADKHFISEIIKEFDVKKDMSSDNTVEVILPIIKYFYPDSNIVCLRIGSGYESIHLGSIIYQISRNLKRTTLVIGSTDLTHYGSNFSFSPHGTGDKAVDWVKKINDKKLVDKMLDMNFEGVLEAAHNDFSACSSGAAVAAIKFASLSNINSGNLVGYLNSYDILPSESFVGYVGITY